MPTTNEIEVLILKSVRLLAEDFDLDPLKAADGNANLYGSEGVLDSMALVNLIADVEDAIYSKYGQSVTLADEKAVSSSKSPFLNVQTLTQAVLERMSE